MNFSENVVHSSKYLYEGRYIGESCLLIEPKKGWLLIYQGVSKSPSDYIYATCAALLKLENP